MFKHRIPLENVTALNILGDVTANLFGFIEVSYIFLSYGNIEWMILHQNQ